MTRTLEKLGMLDRDPLKAKRTVDYTGLKIGAILTPVLLLFIYLGKADMGLAVFIVLGVMIVAIKIRWNLRKHVWFWVTVVFILALHVPFFLLVRWPQGHLPTLFYALPIGIADFLIISRALGLADRFFSKDPSTHEEG